MALFEMFREILTWIRHPLIVGPGNATLWDLNPVYDDHVEFFTRQYQAAGAIVFNPENIYKIMPTRDTWHFLNIESNVRHLQEIFTRACTVRLTSSMLQDARKNPLSPSADTTSDARSHYMLHDYFRIDEISLLNNHTDAVQQAVANTTVAQGAPSTIPASTTTPVLAAKSKSKSAPPPAKAPRVTPIYEHPPDPARAPALTPTLAMHPHRELAKHCFPPWLMHLLTKPPTAGGIHWTTGNGSNTDWAGQIF